MLKFLFLVFRRWRNKDVGYALYNALGFCPHHKLETGVTVTSAHVIDGSGDVRLYTSDNRVYRLIIVEEG